MQQIFSAHYGVDLTLSKDPPSESASKPGPAANLPSAKPKPPRAMQSELSRLMLNVARETYSTTAADEFLPPQDPQGSWVRRPGDSPSTLDRSDTEALQELATKAKDAFEKIRNLSVRKILKDESKAKLFKTAAECQFELGNKLRELAASGKYGFRERLDDASFKCDSRGCEISALYEEVAELGKRKDMSAANAVFYRTEVGDLIKGMAGSMHGNDKSRLFGDQIKSIEDRLAKFSKSTVVGTDDIKQLLAKTKRLGEELKKPEVAQTMDADIYATLTLHLDTLQEQLDNRVNLAVKAAKDSLGKTKGSEEERDMAKRVAREVDNRSWSWEVEGSKANKLSGEDVVNAFRRNDSRSVALEARVHGANEDSINPQLCDRNLLGKSKLGSGAANTVYKMTYRMADGSKKDYVFKPDLNGRLGLEEILPVYNSHKDTQQAVKLNTATCDTAELLGLEGLTGKNYATVHDGQYGLLMELAPGAEAETVSLDTSQDNRKRFTSISVVGKLAKELNDLRWLDIATGQGDRHNSNYMVDFGRDGQTPKVTAIDNDASFVPYLVGVGKYKVDFNPDCFSDFKRELKKQCGQTGASYKKTLRKLRKKDCVIDMKKASKAEICALFKTLGGHSYSQPRQMSRSLCKRLSGLTDVQIKEFAKKLAKNVDNEDCVNAMVRRLKDLRRIAIDYSNNEGGRIVDDDKWGDASVLKMEMERPSLLKGEDLNSESNQTVNYLMSSTLARDFDSLILVKWK